MGTGGSRLKEQEGGRPASTLLMAGQLGVWGGCTPGTDRPGLTIKPGGPRGPWMPLKPMSPGGPCGRQRKGCLCQGYPHSSAPGGWPTFALPVERGHT